MKLGIRKPMIVGHFYGVDECLQLLACLDPDRKGNRRGEFACTRCGVIKAMRFSTVEHAGAYQSKSCGCLSDDARERALAVMIERCGPETCQRMAEHVEVYGQEIWHQIAERFGLYMRFDRVYQQFFPFLLSRIRRLWRERQRERLKEKLGQIARCIQRLGVRATARAFKKLGVTEAVSIFIFRLQKRGEIEGVPALKEETHAANPDVASEPLLGEEQPTNVVEMNALAGQAVTQAGWLSAYTQGGFPGWSTMFRSHLLRLVPRRGSVSSCSGA